MLCLLVLFACAAKAPPAAPMSLPAPTNLDAVAFLAGTWTYVDGATTTTEAWTVPGPDGMAGTSRTCNRAGDCFNEAMAVLLTPPGIVYRATPEGAPTTEFTLVEVGPGKAVFTNPAHDYPRRIVYERAGDVLTATIDDGEGKRRMVWGYVRVGEGEWGAAR